MSDVKRPDKRADEWRTSDAVKVTRACHVEAERRLLAKGKLVSHANLYYGCWSAVLTILSLDERYAGLAMPAACFASAVALWAAYASAEKYEIRALSFKDSYISLQRLWVGFEEAEGRDPCDPKRAKNIRKLRAEYERVLRSTENQTEADYATYRYTELVKARESDKSVEIPWRLWLSYHWWHYVWYILLRLFVYVLVPGILLLSPTIVGWLSAFGQ